jgi:hypothetical protein
MSTVGGGVNIVTNGLVLYLDASNTKSYVSGSTTWNDVSRSGNTGTLTNGPTFNSGNGGSIVFDGSNDFVNLGNILNFERIDSFTFSTWVKVNDVSTPRPFISKTSNTSLVGYFFGANTDNSIIFILRNTINTNQLFISTSSFSFTNIWKNFTVTYDGSSNPSGVSIYVNSILQSNIITTNNLTSTIVNNDNLNIGARTSTGGLSYFFGNISQTSIYNRALSASEVLQNYNATKSRFGL